MFVNLQKYLKTVFLIYVLFLALTPCNDIHAVEYCQTEGIVHLEDKHTDDHHDLCSPLCNCLCCNTIVSISSNNILVMKNASADMETFEHPDIYPLSYKPTSPPPKA